MKSTLWLCATFSLVGVAQAGVQFTPAFPALQFKLPLVLTAPRDGTNRIFVAEQDGKILVFSNSDSASMQTFLDLSALTNSPSDDGGLEEGLLGLAFDPAYKTKREFYVYYSALGPRRNVLARYRTFPNDPGKADPASAKILLQIEKPFSNHNGGNLAFGPDGMLYVGVGDGGSAGDPFNNGQNKNTLLGKILRLDPHDTGGPPYRIPPDNPFVGVPGARGEIWAYGLRNPWRFSFDRETGDLWLGDAGQNRWEEINLVKKGANLGWRLFEGNHPYNPASDTAERAARGEFTAPVAEYPNDASGGSAVIGGYVYRGQKNTSRKGVYYYGDFVSGRVWALVRKNGSVVSNTEVARVSGPSSFGEDEKGEIYVLTLSGKILRLA